MNEGPRVLLATLTRNSAKWLPRFLDCLDCINYPRELMSYAFLDGFSADGSFWMVKGWAAGHERVWIEQSHDIVARRAGGPGYERLACLARLRNMVVDEAWTQRKEEYVFWVDSDVMVPPLVLRKLLAHKKDIVAPMVFIKGTQSFYDISAFKKDGVRFRATKAYNDKLTDGLCELDSVGSCYLVDSSLYGKLQLRYAASESENVVFCNRARAAGCKVYVDTSLRVDHINLPTYGLEWH